LDGVFPPVVIRWPDYSLPALITGFSIQPAEELHAILLILRVRIDSRWWVFEVSKEAADGRFHIAGWPAKILASQKYACAWFLVQAPKIPKELAVIQAYCIATLLITVVEPLDTGPFAATEFRDYPLVITEYRTRTLALPLHIGNQVAEIRYLTVVAIACHVVSSHAESYIRPTATFSISGL
jgi:hypothetical protein